eukprot:scaffold34656_cov178-Amphora_coffeaeformis.AAC.15
MGSHLHKSNPHTRYAAYRLFYGKPMSSRSSIKIYSYNFVYESNSFHLSCSHMATQVGSIASVANKRHRRIYHCRGKSTMHAFRPPSGEIDDERRDEEVR